MNMKELISFLAIWFDNFKKYTFKVDIGATGQLSSFSKDLAKLDADLKAIILGVARLEEQRKIIFPKIDIPTSIKVSNFPASKEFPKSIEVSNLPDFPEFPESVRVSNFPDYPKSQEVRFPEVQKIEGGVTVKNQLSLEEVIKGLQTVVDVINDLRLEIPKSFSAGITTSTSMASKSPEYDTNNVDITSQTNITYIGEETKTGVWRVTKINTASGVIFTYATPINNSSIAGYSQAWSARLSLTYNIFSISK